MVRPYLLLLAAVARASAPDAPPAWLADAFKEFSVVVGSGEVGLTFLDDRVVDVVARLEPDGAVALELRQPGTIVAAAASEERAVGRRRFAPYGDFAALSAEQWLAFTFDAGADGRPLPTVGRARAVVGAPPLLLRTIRRRDDGGGALARVTARAGGADGNPRLDLEVLALSPDRAPLPGAEPRERPLAFPTSGEVLLFAGSSWGHPAWGSFDVVTLDRDHPSWRRGRAATRELVELRSAVPLEADLRERAFGFERVLRVNRMGLSGAPPHEVGAPTLLAWRELKADALASDGSVSSHALVLLRANGEAAGGAWAIARDPARASALDPSLFSAQADDEGRVALPVERRAAGAELEVVAFTAGARARFGTRRGVVAPTGGECVVLLDQRATTTVTVSPPPRRASWIGLHVAGGAFLLPFAADGVVQLPALGEEATLHLGAPYAESAHRLLLAPDAAHPIAATLLPPD